MEKLLSLVWFPVFPAYFGGQKGIAGFYRSLSAYLSVDCLCAAANQRSGNENLQVLSNLPNSKWQFVNPAVWLKIKRQFRTQQYRYVLIEFPYYGLIGYWLRRKGAVYLLHAHNIESQRFKSLQKWWWPALYWYERWAMKQANLVLFKTVADKTYAVRHFSLEEGKTYVLPYGFTPEPEPGPQDCRSLLEQRHAIGPGEKIFLFAGTLDYAPNAEAVLAIYHHIAPRLCEKKVCFRIIICGRNREARFSYLKNLRHPNVIQAGFVHDILPYFRGCDVFINPVQKTFGVQTKIVDAIARHLSVVAFTQAADGLPSYLLNKKLFLARQSDYNAFVQNILLAADESLPTPARFFEEFNWDTIASEFVKKLNALRS